MGTERRERQKANRQLRQEELAKQQRRRSLTKRGVRIGILAGVILLAAVIIALISGGDDDTNDDEPPATTAPAAVVASTEMTGTSEAAPSSGVGADTADDVTETTE